LSKGEVGIGEELNVEENHQMLDYIIVIDGEGTTGKVKGECKKQTF